MAEIFSPVPGVEAPKTTRGVAKEISSQIVPGLDVQDRTDGYQTIADFGRSNVPLTDMEAYFFPRMDKVISGGNGSTNFIEIIDEQTLVRLNEERHLAGSAKGLASSPEIEGLSVNRFTVYRSQQSTKREKIH